MLERVVGEAVRVAPTAVIGREYSDGFDLPEAEFVPDDEPGLGPIGGLRTALAHFGGPVLAVGCDMPLVDSDAFEWLVEMFENESPPGGLVAENEEGLQPLFAVYRPEVEEVTRRMIERGERSLHRLVERSSVIVRETPDAVGRKLVNVNTPEEYDELTR